MFLMTTAYRDTGLGSFHKHVVAHLKKVLFKCKTTRLVFFNSIAVLCIFSVWCAIKLYSLSLTDIVCVCKKTICVHFRFSLFY